MITSSQRAFLKSLAHSLDPVVMVGKNGITENVIQETENSLKAHELIKGKVLETALMTAGETLSALAEATCAEPVQAIGNKFVLYRENPEIPKDKRIQLPKKK
ncbi:MAG: ribosome assembly RNA-binding protein YhbY [Oscillospiraceae bacterium]|nr:ribosome assembly RNA-binding protein YhbY [Oscillospiraceae bacterium]